MGYHCNLLGLIFHSPLPGKMGTSWDGVKREALNRLECRRTICNCVSLRWLGTVVCF